MNPLASRRHFGRTVPTAREGNAIREESPMALCRRAIVRLFLEALARTCFQGCVAPPTRSCRAAAPSRAARRQTAVELRCGVTMRAELRTLQGTRQASPPYRLVRTANASSPAAWMGLRRCGTPARSATLGRPIATWSCRRSERRASGGGPNANVDPVVAGSSSVVLSFCLSRLYGAN